MVRKIINWYDSLFYYTYSRLKNKGEKDAEAPTIAFLTFCGMNFSTSIYLIILWLISRHKELSIYSVIYFAIFSAIVIYAINIYIYVWKNRIKIIQKNSNLIHKHKYDSIILIFGSILVLYGIFIFLIKFGGLTFSK